MTKLQKEIVDLARRRIESEPWFSGGVCLDRLPSDREIRLSREDAVCRLVDDTWFWDAPWS